MRQAHVEIYVTIYLIAFFLLFGFGGFVLAFLILVHAFHFTIYASLPKIDLRIEIAMLKLVYPENFMSFGHSEDQ